MPSLPSLLPRRDHARPWLYLMGSLKERMKLCPRTLIVSQKCNSSGGQGRRAKILDIQETFMNELHGLENLGLEGACNLSDLLNRDQPYINYDKDLLAKEE